MIDTMDYIWTLLDVPLHCDLYVMYVLGSHGVIIQLLNRLMHFRCLQVDRQQAWTHSLIAELVPCCMLACALSLYLMLNAYTFACGLLDS